MKLHKNEDGSFEIDALEITLQKSLWEKISGVFWGGVKVVLIFTLIGIAFGANEIEKNFDTQSIEKTYYDSYFREVSPQPESIHIATIRLDGAITSAQTPPLSSDFTNAEEFIGILVNAIEDDEIDAVLIRINSPGGEVLATEQIATTIDMVKKKSEKKIYVLLEGMAASGGYYVATSGEQIYAYPETLLGNIGVRIDLPKVKELMSKIGVEMNSITSGKMKTIGSPFRDMTEEEIAIFQSLVDESYKKFVERVAQGRGMKYEEAKKLADGRIYSGMQAKENKLIDTLISSFPELATHIATDMKKSNTDIQFVSFQPQISGFEKFFMGMRGEISGLQSELTLAPSTQFLAQ